MSEILTKEKVQRMRSKGERGAHLWPHQVGELCDSHEALRAQVADYEQRGVNDTDLGSVLRRAIEAQAFTTEFLLLGIIWKNFRVALKPGGRRLKPSVAICVTFGTRRYPCWMSTPSSARPRPSKQWERKDEQ